MKRRNSPLPRLASPRRVRRAAQVALGSTLGLWPAALHADVIDFFMSLDGFQETPAVETDAFGEGTASYDTDTNVLTWNITFEGLSSPETAAHFHGAANYCEPAGIQVGLSLGSPKVGDAVLTEAQEADLLAGRWYVNIHSQNHPTGEIRGQVDRTPIDDPIPAGIATSPLGIRLETVATGLTAPNWGTSAPSVPGRLYATDQDGILWNVNMVTGEKSVFLDVSARLVELGVFGPDSFDERGLLGVAFHPGYATNGRLYTFTSEPVDPNRPADYSTMPPGVAADHVSIIAEWRVANPSDPDAVVDPNSRRELLRVDHPQFNHNGGCLAFGPDNLLYITIGDGGNADDQEGGLDFNGNPVHGHGCNGNGQNIDVPLGKMLRINPLGNNSNNGQYGIPASNPFVNSIGLDEIYAYGLRNPFRFSFDRLSGTLVCCDVGQNDIEEVNVIERGGNYGWNVKEGTFRFVRNGLGSGYVTVTDGLNRPDLIDPIAEYDHDEGLSALTGFVYRGSRIPQLNGVFVFGEFAQFFNSDARLFHLDKSLDINEFQIAGLPEGPDFFLLGFGEDADGEIYALANFTGVPFQETGVIYRLETGPNLEIIDPCPGATTATVTGAAPGGRVAFLAATGMGNVTVPPGNPCAGTTLGLDGSARVVASVFADGSGNASATGQTSPSLCGRVFVQAIDVSTCATSDVEGL